MTINASGMDETSKDSIFQNFTELTSGIKKILAEAQKNYPIGTIWLFTSNPFRGRWYRGTVFRVVELPKIEAHTPSSREEELYLIEHGSNPYPTIVDDVWSSQTVQFTVEYYHIDDPQKTIQTKKLVTDTTGIVPRTWLTSNTQLAAELWSYFPKASSVSSDMKSRASEALVTP